MNVERQHVTSLTTALGVQLSYAVSTPWAILTPQVMAEWVHEFKNDSRSIRATFVHDPTPDGATTITLQTEGPDRDFFNVGVGLAATFRVGLSAFVYCETVFGLRDVTAHNVAFGVPTRKALANESRLLRLPDVERGWFLSIAAADPLAAPGGTGCGKQETLSASIPA